VPNRIEPRPAACRDGPLHCALSVSAAASTPAHCASSSFVGKETALSLAVAAGAMIALLLAGEKTGDTFLLVPDVVFQKLPGDLEAVADGPASHDAKQESHRLAFQISRNKRSDGAGRV